MAGQRADFALGHNGHLTSVALMRMYYLMHAAAHQLSRGAFPSLNPATHLMGLYGLNLLDDFARNITHCVEVKSIFGRSGVSPPSPSES